MDLDILDKKIRRLACKLKKYEVNLEIFEHESIVYGPLLGKGGESVVRSCTVVYNGIPIDGAAKTLLDCSDDAISITLDEIEMLCLARDPIVTTTLQVYGVAAVPEETNPEMGHLVIITEAGVMNGLQLYQREEVPAFVTYDLWSRLAAAIHCMHLKKIIHQDLKPENVLVTGVVRDPVGQICKVDFKIIDLGMAKRVINEKVVTDDIVGTNGYHAPEVLFDDTYDYKADIFQLGISFCVMLHTPEFLKGNALPDLLKSIHTAKHDNQTGKVLYDGVIVPTLPESLNMSTRIRNMLIKMLEKQEKRTIPLLEIVELCREESENRRDAASNLPPILSPYMAHNSPDSGIGGGTGNGGSSKKRAKRRRSNSSRRRSTRRSDRSNISNVSGSSSVENHAPDTASPPIVRRTRAMKRTTSVFLQEHGNPHGDPFETPPPAKRTRSCTSLWR